MCYACFLRVYNVHGSLALLHFYFWLIAILIFYLLTV